MPQPARAMEGCFRILALWGASNAEAQRILGAPSPRTFFEWKAGRVRRVPEDTLRRIGYVAGIYREVSAMIADAGLDHVQAKAGCARCQACSGLSAWERLEQRTRVRDGDDLLVGQRD